MYTILFSGWLEVSTGTIIITIISSNERRTATKACTQLENDEHMHRPMTYSELHIRAERTHNSHLALISTGRHCMCLRVALYCIKALALWWMVRVCVWVVSNIPIFETRPYDGGLYEIAWLYLLPSGGNGALCICIGYIYIRLSVCCALNGISMFFLFDFSRALGRKCKRSHGEPVIVLVCWIVHRMGVVCWIRRRRRNSSSKIATKPRSNSQASGISGCNSEY